MVPLFKGQDPRLLNDAYLQNPIYTSGAANPRIGTSSGAAVDGITGVRSMVATGGGIESPTYTQLGRLMTFNAVDTIVETVLPDGKI